MKTIFSLLLCTLFASSQFFSQSESPQEHCLSISDSELTIYEALLKHAGSTEASRYFLEDEALKKSLSSDGNFTLFHPTSQAFHDFFSYFAWKGRPISKNYLHNILKFHVLSGAHFKADWSEGSNMMRSMMTSADYTNMNGAAQRLNVIKDGRRLLVNFGIPDYPKTTAKVIMADIKCKNGVIHVINKVLWFPRFASATLEDGGARAYLSLISSVNLKSYIDVGSNITIFAPLNTVLDAAIGDMNPNFPLLQNILKGHLARGSLSSKEIGAMGEVVMLNGKKVKVDLVDHTFLIGGAKVVMKDILIRNGILHIVDNLMKVHDDVGKLKRLEL